MFNETKAGKAGESELDTLLGTFGQIKTRKSALNLPWIKTASDSPYFVTENGDNWHPVGQNDAISWVDLAGIFRRRDMPGVESYLQTLAGHGVTCLRLMLEYSQVRHRYLERPIGSFQPNMIRLWDDLFALCGKYGLRILLTPFDTFWMYLHCRHHPYNKKNGGVCGHPSQWLICPETRSAIKRRIAFAAERWGGSGVLFAWDIWNEIHPAHGGNTTDYFFDFIEDVSGFLRKTEIRLYGKSHPQTVSIFHPVMQTDSRIPEIIFRHPALDFANIHLYEKKTIDNPRNTVGAAISTGRLIREALAEITDSRPCFDSEHGPIHLFKDRHITLSEPFDDEYFRHIQWAHFASGGAGGGMRWANRHPHRLTRGMRAAQKSLAGFLPLIDWKNFRRRNLNEETLLSDANFKSFACGDESQVIIWILRTNKIGADGRLRDDVRARSINVKIPGLKAGNYKVTMWETETGAVVSDEAIAHDGNGFLTLPATAQKDLALAVRFTNL